MNYYFNKLIIILITLVSGQSLYAQTEDDIKALSKFFPTPKGSYSTIKEALIKPEKVLHLNLGMRGLEKFPIEILKFKNLLELDLYSNNITEIPSWIIKLTKLKKLSVRGNKLKSIPANVFYLPSLTELDLWGNQISTFPILTSKTSSVLVDLNLSMNKFKDLPESIIRLVQLRTLRLENNLFTKIPSIVFKMTKLEYLNLLHNRIYEFSIEFPIVSNLKGIDLAFNPISNKKVEELKNILPNCIISTEL